MIGIDAERARAQITSLRERASQSGNAQLRLAADEIDCRLLGDTDNDAAIQVADAGLQETQADAGAQASDARARLRACRAGAWIESGRVAQGEAEIEDILRETGANPDTAGHALALLERGLHRSRTGYLDSGQSDLLDACAALQRLERPRDSELCLSHLANHFKRVGDTEESLRILNQLVDTARARGARIDESIYLFGIAQVYHEHQDWTQALDYYERAQAASKQLKDPAGIAYAENGIAAILLRFGRAAEALPLLREARSLLRDEQDHKQILRIELRIAQAQTQLGQTSNAARDIATLRQKVVDYRDDTMYAEWLHDYADNEAALGHGEEAYRLLDAWRIVDARMNAQRVSENTARLRMEFNRDKDAAELRAARQLQDQAERLNRVRILALSLALALITIALGFAVIRVRRARQAHRLSLTDELTGLPNRRAILAYLENCAHQSARQRAHLSVLMIDVDHFKEVNDKHGHATGDQVLLHITSVASRSMRARDRIGRLGGEEFLVVLPETGAGEAIAIGERIRMSIDAAPAKTHSGELPVTVSVGVASSVAGVPATATLIERSDAALYAAKAQGRNRTISEPLAASAPEIRSPGA